jgi:hypothetical protein
MDAMDTLSQEKVELLEQIAKAAKDGRSDIVLSASEKLGKVEMLINRYKQLVNDIESLQGKAGGSGAIETAKVIQEQPMIVRTDIKSARENGREIREAFIKKLTGIGIELQQAKGETIYKTRSGEKVGIAVATERQPDRWFLGLPVGGFDHAVLLCKREGGEVIEIRLPKGFFSKYIRDMSQSKGQLKFNVSRRGNAFVVQVPNTDGVNPSTFSSDYSFLY